MRVAVPLETRVGEKRVALVPDIINKLTRLGLEVAIESGAGLTSQASDAEYETAGASIVKGDVLGSADIVLSVQPLTPSQMGKLKKGAITISFLSTAKDQD
jgi:H+-translocating NAD(P) transhydrogenase subunit alpha